MCNNNKTLSENTLWTQSIWLWITLFYTHWISLHKHFCVLSAMAGERSSESAAQPMRWNQENLTLWFLQKHSCALPLNHVKFFVNRKETNAYRSCQHVRYIPYDLTNCGDGKHRFCTHDVARPVWIRSVLNNSSICFSCEKSCKMFNCIHQTVWPPWLPPRVQQCSDGVKTRSSSN